MATKESKPKKKKSGLLVRAVVVLDESGSMLPIQEATVEAFNEYKNTLTKTDPNTLLSLYKFSNVDFAQNDSPDNFRTVAHNLRVADFPDLTAETYDPDGTTPLYDAFGKAISRTDSDWNPKKESVLVIVMTDGLENASKEYSNDAVKKLVEDKEKLGWTFVYLGANQDPWAVAHQIGVNAANTMRFAASDVGMTKTMSSLAGATSSHGAYAQSAGQQTNASLFANAGQSAADYDDTPYPKKTKKKK